MILAKFSNFSSNRSLSSYSVARPSLIRCSLWIKPSVLRKRSWKARVHLGLRRTVATSEYWYEDEQEYDAVKEILSPKRIYLVSAPPTNFEGLAKTCTESFSALTFHAAFTGTQMQKFAEMLWEGRGGPPLFRKLRVREALDTGFLEPGSAAAFWEENCEQNWKIDLDFGLPGAKLSPFESILVVSDKAGVNALLAALPASANQSYSDTSLATETEFSVTKVSMKGSQDVEEFRVTGESSAVADDAPRWLKLQAEIEWRHSEEHMLQSEPFA